MKKKTFLTTNKHHFIYSFYFNNCKSVIKRKRSWKTSFSPTLMKFPNIKPTSLHLNYENSKLNYEACCRKKPLDDFNRKINKNVRANISPNVKIHFP
ncbi:hypothetical protein KFK09_025041 [Dendrobium nobile]|uniref:Uncharacterized protein n=1 Tax=Dendrobium nobile TaxID=94219 RepID=A0A8T3AKX7_DENNO|nr:hypothetical protein KFK09_025041 [Dendrobium nobile]